MRYDSFTFEDENKFLEFTKKGIACVFVYTDRLIYNGQRTVYNEQDRNERAIAVDGEIYVPLSFFTRFLGAECTIKNDQRILSFKDKAIQINGMQKNGCFDARGIAQEFGFCARYFCEKKFLIIGQREDVLFLSENLNLVKAGSYALFGEYQPQNLTEADYENVINKYHQRLCGDEKINDLQNPNVIKKLDAIDKNCKQALDTLDRSGDPVVLWGTKPLRDTDDGYEQYKKVFCLACGHCTYGSRYYHDKSVLNDIIYALEWMYRHAYGEDLINGKGWRDPELPNWWHWYIGAPEILTDILIMLHKEISMSDRKRYLKCFLWINTWMCTDPVQWYMTRLKIRTKYGILLHDPTFLKTSNEDFDRTIEITHPDYLNFSHQYPHNISYGAVIPERALFVASLLSGTALEYLTPSVYTLFYLAKYMFDPAMYKGQGMFMLGGRHTYSMVEINAGANILSKYLCMLGMFGEDEDNFIKGFIKRHSCTEDMRNAVIFSASFYDLAKYEQILSDDSIPYEIDNDYAYAWYTGDRAVQHRSGYAVGIAMASNRHINYESILHQNKNGWYTGDGAMHLYTSYDSHQYDGKNFMQNMNIAYRFPGTTEDMQQRSVRGIGYNPWKTPEHYAGCMQFDGQYIIAAMKFVSEYCEDEKEDYDEVRGYSPAFHKNDLSAKKSWFCFDGDIIALGAAINSSMDSPVNTTVAHRRIVKDGIPQYIKSDGLYEELPKKEFESRYKEPKYFLWQGHAGYVFLSKSDVYLSRYNYTTEAGEQPYIELRIEHGINPCSESYAYAVIPYATKEKLDKYCACPEVTIIENSDKIAAVYKKSLCITAYVFYEGGTCQNVEVSDGAIVTIANRNGGIIDISICEPTQLLNKLTVKLRGEFSCIDKDEKIVFENKKGFSEMTLDTDSARGRAFAIKLQEIK